MDFPLHHLITFLLLTRFGFFSPSMNLNGAPNEPISYESKVGIETTKSDQIGNAIPTQADSIPVNDEVHLSITSIDTAEVGEQICLSLLVVEPVLLSGLQLSFSFDGIVLQFDTILNIHPEMEGKVTDLFNAQKFGGDIPEDKILHSWVKFTGGAG